MFWGVPLVILNALVVGAGGVPVPAVKPDIPLWAEIVAVFEVKLTPLESPELTQPIASSGESHISNLIAPIFPVVPGLKPNEYVVTAPAAELPRVSTRLVGVTA